MKYDTSFIISSTEIQLDHWGAFYAGGLPMSIFCFCGGIGTCVFLISGCNVMLCNRVDLLCWAFSPAMASQNYVENYHNFVTLQITLRVKSRVASTPIVYAIYLIVYFHKKIYALT